MPAPQHPSAVLASTAIILNFPTDGARRMAASTYAEIIIGGGGIAGCSTVYHPQRWGAALRVPAPAAGAGRGHCVAGHLWHCVVGHDPGASGHGGGITRNLDVFAALLGVWLLKEVFTPRRVIGTCAIAAGVMAVRLG